MSNHAALKHLAWKELTQQFPIWLTLMIMNLVLLGIIFINQSGEYQASMALLAGTFTSIYAVASAVTLFSMEKELKTFYFVQNLPVSPQQFGVTKLGVGLSLIVAFMLIGGAIIYFPIRNWLQVSTPNVSAIWYVFLGFVLPPIEIFIYTAFCSIFIRRTIYAAIAGILLTGLVFFCLGMMNAVPGFGRQESSWFFSASGIWGTRFLILTIALVANLLLAGRWLGVTFETSQHRVTERLAVAKPGHRNRGILHRLLWQSICEKWTTVFWGFCLIPLSIALSVFLSINLFSSDLAGNENAYFFQMLTVGVAIGVAVCGSWTFSGDQRRNQKMFFVQQFETPGLIWFSRCLTQCLMTGIALTAGLTIATFALWYFTGSNFMLSVLALFSDPNLVNYVYSSELAIISRVPNNLVFSLTSICFAFAIGHWFSMLIRQPVICMVFAALGGFAACFWMRFMKDQQFSFWWSVWPIIGFLFLATFLLSPRWLRGADNIWQKAVSGCIVAIPFAAVLVLMPTIRLGQVPDIEISEATKARIENLTGADAISAAESCKIGLDLYVNNLPEPESNSQTRELDILPWTDRNLTEWDQDLLDQFVADNERCYQRLRVADEAEFCYPFLDDYLHSKRKSLELKKVYLVYATRAEQELRKGNLEPCFEYLVAMRRLMRNVTSLPNSGSQVSYRLYDDFARWTNHPEMTEALIDKAMLWVREPITFRSQHRDWFANYVFMTKNRDGRISKFLEPGQHLGNRTMLSVGWEQKRADRLGWILAERTGHFPPANSRFDEELRFNPEGWVIRHSNDRGGYAFVAAHPDDYPLFHQSRGNWGNWQRWRQGQSERFGPSLTSFYEENLHFLLTAKLALIRYRIRNGTYPDSIDSLPAAYIKDPHHGVVSPMSWDAYPLPLVLSKGKKWPVVLQLKTVVSSDETRSLHDRKYDASLFDADTPYLLDFYHTPVLVEVGGEKKIRLKSKFQDYRMDEEDQLAIKYQRYPNIFRLPKIEDKE